MGQENLVEKLTGKRVAFVVAHQDDESLWFGGLLTELAGKADLLIVSVTEPMPARPDTYTRMKAISEVAKLVSGTHVCLGFTDCRAVERPESTLAEVTMAIAKHLREFQVDAIVSHGLDGEACDVYPTGHAMHKHVCLAANQAATMLRLDSYRRSRIPDATFRVEYDRNAKFDLLDCYAPQWSPDGYPWNETEGYEFMPYGSLSHWWFSQCAYRLLFPAQRITNRVLTRN